MIGDPDHVERVAESLWKAVTTAIGSSSEVHEAWLVLPDEEKQTWRDRGMEAILDWKAKP